jgi:hypothetical protein
VGHALGHLQTTADVAAIVACRRRRRMNNHHVR